MKKHILLCSIFTSVSCSAEPLFIHGKDHLTELNVTVVDKEDTREKGLMFRKSLDPKEGMLFVYPSTRKVRMWMKNTYVPLDMLFVDQKGTIVHIHENAEPHSLKTIESTKPVIAVIEIAGGEAKKLDLHVGDLVKHPAFSGK